MKLISLITLLLFLQNCGWGFQIDKGRGDKFKANFILENGTDHKIELKFYRYGRQYIDFEEQNILNNKGDILLQSYIARSIPAHATGAFWCDSLFIIFDDSRKGKIIVNGDTTGLTSALLEGIDKNILLTEVYTVESKESYRYVFTEKDYDNAIDCNGNCD